VLARIEGPRSTVEVYREGDYRCLRFAGGGGLVQGRMHLDRPLDFGCPYLAPMCAAATAVEAPRSALCLGLGVGALPRMLRAMWPGLRVDVVEIDPAIIAAAAQHFDCGEAPGRRILRADAAAFVRRPPPGPPYDLALLDCYDADRLPAALVEGAFVRDLLALIGPAGVLVANVVSSRRGAEALGQHLASRLCGAAVIPVSGRSNRIWFGGRARTPDPAAMARRCAALDARVPFALAGSVERMRTIDGDWRRA